MLVNQIINDVSLKDIRLWRLDTMDAHKLYKKHGFKEPARPERIMERRKFANQSFNSGG